MIGDLYPKQVYLIFPFDENGKIEGVYVGSSNDVRSRVKNHRNDHHSSGKQKILHDLMRKNGYDYLIVDEIKSFHENHVEYDWMDFFIKNTTFQLFNNQVGLCGADWHRLKVTV